MTAPLRANLRSLRTKIAKALDGENNVTVYIYISDELDEPICLQMGNGENELVIDIEEDAIDFIWTRRTFWKKTRDFFSEAAHNIVEALRSVIKSAMAIGGSALKAITYL